MVTCREYLEFISDDAYTRPEFWLSEGCETLKQTGWTAPLYWDRDSNDQTGWRVFTLRGWKGLSALLDSPVCHISFYEADAFARWRGCRLPTEAEWECVASQVPPQGNLLDAGRLHPARQAVSALSNSSATAGSGRPAPTRVTRVTSQFLARSANTTASLCPVRWFYVEGPASRLRVMCVQPIAISFNHPRGGSSVEYVWQLKRIIAHDNLRFPLFVVRCPWLA